MPKQPSEVEIRRDRYRTRGSRLFASLCTIAGEGERVPTCCRNPLINARNHSGGSAPLRLGGRKQPRPPGNRRTRLARMSRQDNEANWRTASQVRSDRVRPQKIIFPFFLSKKLFTPFEAYSASRLIFSCSVCLTCLFLLSRTLNIEMMADGSIG